MFGFLKKAVGSLIDGVKKKLERKDAEEVQEPEKEIFPEPIQEVSPKTESPIVEEIGTSPLLAETVEETKTPTLEEREEKKAEEIFPPEKPEEEKQLPEKIQAPKIQIVAAPEKFFEEEEEEKPKVPPEKEPVGKSQATPVAMSEARPAAIPVAERPEAERPEAEKPEAEKPEAEKPEAEKPEAKAPPKEEKPSAIEIVLSGRTPGLERARQQKHEEIIAAATISRERDSSEPEKEKEEEKKKSQKAVKVVFKKEPKPETKTPVPAEIPPVPKEEKKIQSVPEEKKDEGFFGKIFGGLKKATKTVVKTVTEKTVTESDVSELLTKFEFELIQANVAPAVSERICADIKRSLVGTKISRTADISEAVLTSLRESILSIVKTPSEDFTKLLSKNKPCLVLFLGFNGTGKTTTIAKVANLLKQRGISCVIAAGDTFRAAAIEQAKVHGERLGVKVISQSYGADSAAVIFDAVKHAKAAGIDVVLADTAGRQHTNSNLMEELRKIVRVNKPDVKILVVDSLSGSDSVLQAKNFDEVVGGIDGAILTKVDVDEKGGAVISVAHTIGKPIFFFGIGQDYSQLKPFDADDYVQHLLG